MKWTILIVLFLLTRSSNGQTMHSPTINLNTFTSTPKDLDDGAGESFYLSRKDEKDGKLICTTDYMTALIYVNQKPIRLKAKNVETFSKSKQIFTFEKYTLTILESHSKDIGDEDYTMKATLILKYNSKVVWMKSVRGDGGA